jgi:hypothetical protein
MGGERGTQNLEIREYEVQKTWYKRGKSAVRQLSG